MISKWKTEPLKGVISYIAKGISPAYVEVESENTVRVLNQKCNRDFAINYTESRLNDLSRQSVPQEKYLRDGDILINSTGTGTAGRIAQLYTVPCPTVVDGHMIVLRGNEKVRYRYLGYALKAQQAYVFQLDEGSTGQTELNRERLLSEIEVSYPISLDEQQAIADTLSALDDKIANNTKINHHLEQMAQAIFKSWFVDFEPVRAKIAGESRESICKRLKITPEILDLFPDRLVDSELGEIPEGWGVRSLGELVNIIKGRSYKSEELSESETALVTLKSFARGGGYRIDGLKPYTGTYKPEQLLHSGDMLIACTDVTQAAEVIGRPIIIRESARYRNLVASLDTIIVRPLNPSLNPTYLYYLCATDLFVGHTSTYATGTTVLHLSKEAIPSFRFAFATHNLIDIFQRKVLPLLKQNEVIEIENEQLVSIRDALLPRLMSGELSVADISDAK